MAEITAALVKELRDVTGAGMMDCKRALNENNADIESSIDWLRSQGLAAAAKKSGRAMMPGHAASQPGLLGLCQASACSGASSWTGRRRPSPGLSARWQSAGPSRMALRDTMHEMLTYEHELSWLPLHAGSQRPLQPHGR